MISLAGLGQVDVIEAQFALLSSRIRGARDFKEVERAHQAYLDALLSQCFLDMRQIGQMLEAVFALCQRLCNYIQVRTVQTTSLFPVLVLWGCDSCASPSGPFCGNASTSSKCHLCFFLVCIFTIITIIFFLRMMKCVY